VWQRVGCDGVFWNVGSFRRCHWNVLLVGSTRSGLAVIVCCRLKLHGSVLAGGSVPYRGSLERRLSRASNRSDL
jgi:hypothetical protein